MPFTEEKTMLATQEKETYYPESDGQPMAETDVHRVLLTRMVELLGQAFPEAYVSGNICLYYVPGNAQKMISPDALLSLSQPPGRKQVYKAWEPNNQLDLVMEFTSKSTKRNDYHKKKKIYEQILQVPNYLIYDPHSMALDLFTLKEGHYQSIPSNDKGYWEIADLGIQVGLELPHSLCLFDAAGHRIPSEAEKNEQAREKEQRAREEAQKQAVKEREAKELAEQQKEAAQQEAMQEREAKELAKQQKNVAEQEAMQERQAKELAEQETMQEREAKELAEQQKDAAQQELEILKAQLKALQGN